MYPELQGMVRPQSSNNNRPVYEPWLIWGVLKYIWLHRIENDDFSQPRALFELMSDYQKEQLFSNIAESMNGVPKNIIDRQLALFEQVHTDYAFGVKKALGF